ncbi:hypothetical protein HDE_09262 [Halotydeus destructor]|nr:hypothetical protein HDE_09262 [Halotydeus destructor]
MDTLLMVGLVASLTTVHTNQMTKTCYYYENSDLFLFDMQFFDCHLDCYFLTSSYSPSRFHDASKLFSHRFGDGTKCGKDSSDVCVNGKCISGWLQMKSPVKKSGNTSPRQNPLTSTGTVLVLVQRAHVPKKDRLSKADPYVQVFISSGDGSQSLLGTTRMIRNNHEPEFNQHFQGRSVSSNSSVILHIADYDDMDEDDKIGTVSVRIDDLIQHKLIGKALKRKVPYGWIQFTIFWYPGVPPAL